ncbi:MAG: hypothetical protein IIB54_08585, partial [Planctomycetes bacterium]|nr:hypothetical protein [Planctomycetota bacterium]
MATLDKNTPRSFEMGPRSHFPVIGSETIFEGAAVVWVDATGYARPLSVADRSVGFAVEKIN